MQDLDSIEMILVDPRDEDNPEGRVLAIDGSEASVWVGPIATRGSQLVPLSEAGMTMPYAMGGDPFEQRNIINWMAEKSATDADMTTINMVNVNTLKDYIEAHPTEADKLLKSIRFVWGKLTDDNINLPPQGYVTLQYRLHTPLNLPKYTGNLTGDPIFDMNLDISQPDLNPDLAERLAEVTQWNTYAQRVTTNGRMSGNDELVELREVSQAGVFVNAPDDRGYLGDYVWMDPDWDGLQNDTLGDTVKDALGRETTYHQAANGRFLISTDKTVDDETGQWTGLYGDGLHTADILEDVNFDGKVEDPGINGVKVELLNEYGLPCNRDGEVAVLRNDELTNFEDAWVVADPRTGVPLRNELDGYIGATTGEPYSYVTESDYYDNKGYWILSNLKPGKYKLRFTFPREYCQYSLTTKITGPDDARNPLLVTRDNNQMVVTTQNAIDVKAVEYDKDAFEAGQPDLVHQRYDARATSYDVGIARPVTYTGVVFRDDMLDDQTEEDPDDINGVLDYVGIDMSAADPMTSGKQQRELRLQNMRVTVHEYDPLTDTWKDEAAIDADGNKASRDSNANGEFSFRLKPDKYYVITCEDLRPRLLKPTVYTWNDDALALPAAGSNVWDNDLRYM